MSRKLFTCEDPLPLITVPFMQPISTIITIWKPPLRPPQCGRLVSMAPYCKKMVQFKCRRLRITLEAPFSAIRPRPLTSYMGNQTPAVEVGRQGKKELSSGQTARWA